MSSVPEAAQGPHVSYPKPKNLHSKLVEVHSKRTLSFYSTTPILHQSLPGYRCVTHHSIPPSEEQRVPYHLRCPWKRQGWPSWSAGAEPSRACGTELSSEWQGTSSRSGIWAGTKGTKASPSAPAHPVPFEMDEGRGDINAKSPGRWGASQIPAPQHTPHIVSSSVIIW